MGFTPANFTVNVGDTVSFEVIDPVDAHEVAFNSSGEFNSARMKRNCYFLAFKFGH
jgi:plastocyanin